MTLQYLAGFLEEKGIKVKLTPQRKREEHHLQTNDLRVKGLPSTIEMGKLLLKCSKHSKKLNRINHYLNKIRPLIKKNGQYSAEEKLMLRKLEQEFIDIKE